MLALALGTIGLVFSFLVVLSFVCWAVHEHLIAQKYRNLVRLSKSSKLNLVPSSSSPRWRIIYKARGKRVTAEFAASSESEALKELVKGGVRYEDVVSSVKV